TLKNEVDQLSKIQHNYNKDLFELYRRRNAARQNP
ncbi:unnamed protein product, partial [Rotaria magnacalcarata]